MSDILYQVQDMHLSLPDRTKKRVFGTAPMLEILKGLRFDIHRGEVMGIVGGSGSGKSTTGRALVRLLEPTSGRVTFDGTDITHLGDAALRPLRRRFQMFFQDPLSSLNPRHNVRGIIAAPLKLHGFDNVDGRVGQALEQVGLPDSFRHRFPHEMSGGQRQRIGIARAIAMEPDFILADEIVSGLDVSNQAQILTLLERLVADLNLTLGFVSHDLSVIRRLCDRVMVMQEGRIVEMGDVSPVFDTPQDAYTRELLDAIPLPDPDQDWNVA
ncbi:MAG: ATP-binding cassette domain-containing protein [Paracoccaceae bacterium]